MQYDVHEVAPHEYVIVLDRGEPLPVIFDDRVKAQRMAARLRRSQSRSAGAASTTPAARSGRPARMSRWLD
jgi:hypothetical protein